jgi:organic anion transporter 5A
MTGNETSQILFSIVLSYYGGRGHRPRWIAVGVLFSAFSCFVLASPHAFYGPGNDALSLTQEYAAMFDTDLPSTAATLSNMTSKGSLGKTQICRLGGINKGARDCDSSDTSLIPLVLIFASQFFMGIGVLLFFSLGGNYTLTFSIINNYSLLIANSKEEFNHRALS